MIFDQFEKKKKNGFSCRGKPYKINFTIGFLLMGNGSFGKRDILDMNQNAKIGCLTAISGCSLFLIGDKNILKVDITVNFLESF